MPIQDTGRVAVLSIVLDHRKGYSPQLAERDQCLSPSATNNHINQGARLLQPNTFSDIFAMIAVIGVMILFWLSASLAARNQRKRMIRRLVDVHPKDRSAEIKRLADAERIVSVYQESNYETYSDVVDEKEKLASVGP
ncbi:uncharacterized protein LY89DRAFT_664879 [Mollisia scopiformis]|uniref:Uncharacterized protein n=1 Tax=Mollisia scopiformis TaxID=149040 RepID=A0A194XNG8_MOLSC|nr:uncharacterized protein LY89DRAFT_664879 [Mollisia scopiformis]KUJ21703.1 hypothetical protein LY89DRAFT_664879 [Mollisia scopiformis]